MGRPFWHSHVKVAFEGLSKRYRTEKGARHKLKSKISTRKHKKAKDCALTEI
jgi:hypothetical protein